MTKKTKKKLQGDPLKLNISRIGTYDLTRSHNVAVISSEKRVFENPIIQICRIQIALIPEIF